MFTRRALSSVLLGLVAAPAVLRADEARLSKTPGSGGSAAQGPSVIELFTSQGCSSCPPADALMLEFARAPDVIPLTFPVEVWDYLGWKDTLAKPAFTARQRAYAAMVADRRVFTPQAVVNGKASCVGSDLSALAARIKARGVSHASARLHVTPQGEGWQVTAPSLPEGTTPHLFVLPLATRREVAIGRGENSGRKVTYANVVRDIRDLGPLVSGKPILVSRTAVREPMSDGFALLAQLGTAKSPGLILAAALIEAGGVKA